MKTHWLYGWGPNKEIHFKKEIEEETDCTKCIHAKVCDHEKTRRCFNYKCGSGGRDCTGCEHKFTRYDKESIPCFHCKEYLCTNYLIKPNRNEQPRIAKIATYMKNQNSKPPSSDF